MRLSVAQAAVTATLAAARAADAAPVAVMVLDTGAHPVAFAREDGASLFRFDIARAKAHGALGMGTDTRAIAARAADNPAFFTSVTIATGGALALSPGGILIHDRDGALVGAIGVSGDRPDIDEACAKAGAAAYQQGDS
ncbi:GlcG/HbpS family heme-binding protein [Sphingomonas nostoxanthinifaciens]|uniref:GlcG/HbpS family heme-binding protein n=1 Tax=Sphingomonas nostoxanthinifaciens TaxID=2872652 RepID=UPI001CC21B15|nr:heme-binding protein [Sphingomonas nostoxanthinifaciens]UAK22867.1 heme-binding protein [Sphingomonas nostoxanthinifaciens]